MSRTTNRLTRTPGAGIDPALQAFVENLEILNGARGNGMDKAVLMRDLVDLGYITVQKNSQGKIKPSPSNPGGAGSGGTVVDPTVEFPTKPINVNASGGFSNILIDWSSPTYKGHSYAEVWRSDQDDFATAASIGQTAANLYSDSVGSNKTYYYWVRFVNRNNQEGPIQSTAGVKGETSGQIGDILDQLKGQIDESFLTPGLNDRLNNNDTLTQKNADGIYQIEGEIVDINQTTNHLQVEADFLAEAAMSAATGVDEEGNERRKVTADIKEEQKVLITEQAALAQKITSITVSVDDNKAAISSANTAIIQLDDKTSKAVESITQRLDSQQSDIDGNKASITSNSETIVKVDDKITVVSNQLNTVESELGDTKAAVSTNSNTIAKMDKDGTAAYEAQWGVKASVGDIVAGIGLTVKDTPQGKVSQCTIVANQFSIGHVKTDGSEDIVYPFIIAPDPTTGDPGVFIDTAFIKAATVQDLVAGSVVADTVKASAEITAPKIKGGTIKIGSNFAVDENGNLTATNATLSGDITALNGHMSNVTIDETCVVKRLYAEYIYGDIYKAHFLNVSSDINLRIDRGTTRYATIGTLTFEPENWFRKFMIPGGIRIYNSQAGDYVEFLLNGSVVHTFGANGNGYLDSGYYYSFPAEITLNPKVKHTIQMRLKGSLGSGSSSVYVFGYFYKQGMQFATYKDNS